MTSDMTIKVINRYNSESCTLRLSLFKDGECVDIIEGPMRFVIERAMLEVSPDTRLRLRKTVKRKD